MSEEGRDRKLPHRVRAASQGGPAQSTVPVLSEEMRQRMRQAVKAERGAAQGLPDHNPGRALAGETSGLTEDSAVNSVVNGTKRAGGSRPDRTRPRKTERTSTTAGRAQEDTGRERVTRGTGSHGRASAGPDRTGSTRRLPSGSAPVQAGTAGRRRSRSRLRALVVALVAVIALAVVGIRVFGFGHGGLDGASTGASTRGQAATWVAEQVSATASVSCDQLMCAALKADGFPGKLVVLGPTSPAPPDSMLVVVTSAVQSLYGTSLDKAWAPSVLASFGSGTAAVSIRMIAPHGVLPYQAQIRTDQSNRVSYGMVLLSDKQVTLSASAEQQLVAGKVDQRLVLALTDLTQPINILDFGNNGPGASGDVPLRVADLAATDQSAHMGQGPYVRALHNYLNAVSAQFRPTSSILTLGRQVIFRVVVSAPSPLGQFSSGTP
jgi:hypothetical protein